MTEEEKKKKAVDDAAAKAKADKEAADADFEATLEGLSEEEQEQKRAERTEQHTDTEADFKAQLEEERKKREKAEQALADKRFKSKRKKDEGGEEDDEGEDGEEKPLTGRDLDDRLAEERERTLKETQADRIQEIAGTLSESQVEAELIIEIHKNRTWPTGTPLKEQLEEAQAIANRKRNASKTKELARAAQANGTASRDSGSAHRDGMESPAPKLSADDNASYKRAGFSFDSKSKSWKKKLPNGKFLIKDPKTKRTWIE